MKKESTSLFGRFFSPSSNTQTNTPQTHQTRNVFTNSYSQPHVLQQRMKEEQLTHGETVMADISPVRLEMLDDKVLLYFCPVKSIEVTQSITCGDGGDIPGQVVIEGLAITDNYKPGHYSLKNVMITSNGSIQVKATEKTVWERV
jgi:hypothetical protein